MAPPPDLWRSVAVSSLAADIVYCTPWQATRGLMFTRPGDRALVFSFPRAQRIALHMAFVFYPIDVLFLDRNGCIVDMRRGLRPWTCCRSKAPALHAVELPCGRAGDLRPGDRVRLGE